MASTPVITSPADYSTQALPFDITGTSDGVLVEARDDAGLLLPATENPAAVAAGAFTIHVTGTAGNRGAVYATGAGQVALPAAASPVVSSSVSAANTAIGASIGITVPSIPAGAVVLLAVNGGGYTADGTYGATSPNLTFTGRLRYASTIGGGTLMLLTAVAPSALTNEAITFTRTGTNSADYALSCAAAVITAADTVNLSNAGGVQGLATDAVSVPASVQAGSLVVAQLHRSGGEGPGLGDRGFTAGAGTTEILDVPVAGATGPVRTSIALMRNTDPPGAAGTVTLAATMDVIAEEWAATWIEIRRVA